MDAISTGKSLNVTLLLLLLLPRLRGACRERPEMDGPAAVSLASQQITISPLNRRSIEFPTDHDIFQSC